MAIDPVTRDMSVDAFLESYYQALRDGEPLEPFFARDHRAVKFGITESLHGYAEIEDGLTAQTATTTDWSIRSHRLETDTAGEVGWFSDHVTMRWRDIEADEQLEWETRWSGTVLHVDSDWQFVRMHVSAAHEST